MYLNSVHIFKQKVPSAFAASELPVILKSWLALLDVMFCCGSVLPELC